MYGCLFMMRSKRDITSSVYKTSGKRISRENGAATLIIALILLVMGTLIIMFAANYGLMQEKITANIHRNSQAYEAAEGGIEFAINYLQKNATTIIGTPSGGYMTPYSDASTTNVSFNNSSKFSVVYTNPVANNYKIILITSTGTSSDGSATRIVKQQVALSSLLMNYGNTSIVSKGAVNLSGSAEVNNTSTNKTISSGSSVSISGSAETNISSGGGSNASHIGSDITQNSSSISSMSQNDFIASYFGTTSSATIQSKVGHYYSNSSSTNYSSTLNGMSGTSIWIDQTGGTTASISGTTTIGTATNPVLLIVNGTLSITGNVTIYGFVFIIGTSGINTLSGNISINGGLAMTDQLNMSGNSSLTFNPTVLTNLQNNSSMTTWAKIPGTWKDF